MKELKQYIFESLEFDNILWLLDKWFERDETEKEEFMNIIFLCQNDKSLSNIQEYVDKTIVFKNNLKPFINFVYDNDDINNDKKEKDDERYIYQLKELIKMIMDNKAHKNKYNKS